MKRFATAVLVAALSTAAMARDTLDERIAELMERSGNNKALDHIPSIMRDGMQQQRASFKLSDAQFQLLLDAVSNAYDPVALKRAVAKRYHSELAPGDIDAALKWLKSPLGRKANAAEEESASVEADRQMEAWFSEQKEPPRLERVELIGRFDEAIHLSEFGVTLMRHQQLSLGAGLTATQPAEKQRSVFDKVNQVFDERHAELLRMSREHTLKSSLYVYRSLSDTELAQYIAFLLSPAGKRYTDVTTRGLTDAIVQASHNAGTVFGEALRTPTSGS